MHLDPSLPQVATFVLLLVTVHGGARLLRLPTIAVYLLAGAVCGPHGAGLLSNEDLIAGIGNFGVLVLLFLAGAEIRIGELLRGWRISVGGTIAQIMLSILLVALVGLVNHWPPARIVLLGFVASLSSTAVVLGLLREKRLLAAPVGRDVVAVLLAQDVLVGPMLITLQLIGGAIISWATLLKQVVGLCILAGGVLAAQRWRVQLGQWLARLGQDPEQRVFTATAACAGFAVIGGVFGLSTALGAFCGGLVIGRTGQGHWVQDVLHPFFVLFMAGFFLSVGMLVDPAFVLRHSGIVAILTAVVLLSNTVINAAIFRLLGRRWAHALLGGALLAQAGEFGFVLATAGKSAGIITDYAWQMTIVVIALSLALTNFWVRIVGRLIGGNVPDTA